MLELLDCHDEYLLVRDGDDVRGVLPLLRLAAADGGILNSLPYYGSNGGVLAADAEAAAALSRVYDTMALAAETASATVVSNPFVEHAADPVHNYTDERIAHFTSLSGEPLAGVEPSARRNVRRAESAGVSVDVDPDALPDLYRLHDANIRALGGRPKGRRFFDLVRELLVPGEEWQLYGAWIEGDFVAGLLVMYFEQTVEYFTPAIAHRHRSDQPLAAILARAMPDAAARGCTRWNWGGTWLSQESLRRFKRKWGAEERRYRYFVQLNRPWLLDSTPEELRDHFGDFFVLPYGALHRSVARGG